jgi:hypothetical protein
MAVARQRIVAAPIAWGRRAIARIAESEGIEIDPANYLSDTIHAIDARAARRIAMFSTLAWWLLVIGSVVGARRVFRHGWRAVAIAQLAVGFALIDVLARAAGPAGDQFHLALVPLIAPLAAGLFLPARPVGEDPDLVWAT